MKYVSGGKVVSDGLTLTMYPRSEHHLITDSSNIIDVYEDIESTSN